MPLPLAPFMPILVRVGALAVTALATRRWMLANSHPGRTDQRAEDALDDLGEGLTIHHPAEFGGDRDTHQTNASARLRRVIRFRGRAWEVDAGLMARLRLREQAAGEQAE